MIWCHPLLTERIMDNLDRFKPASLRINANYNISRFRLNGPLAMELIMKLIDPKNDTEFGLLCKSLSESVMLNSYFRNEQIFSVSINPTTLKKNYSSIFKCLAAKTRNMPPKENIYSLTQIKENSLHNLLNYGGSDFPLFVSIRNATSGQKTNGLTINLSSGADIIFPKPVSSRILNFLAMHGAKIGGLREYRTICLESFIRQYPDDYPDIYPLHTLDICPIKVSSRKVLKRLKSIQKYHQNISDLLTELCGSLAFTVSKFPSQSELPNQEFGYTFVFVGIIMEGKGVPGRLDAILNKKNNEIEISGHTVREISKSNDFYTVGYITDGDMSLSLGRGVGKGVILSNEFNLLEKLNKPFRKGYIKTDSKKFYDCKIFVIDKCYL